MAVQPLSPATDRRFGGPLPRQLPNRTRAHLCAINLWHGHHAVSVLHAVLASVSGRYSPHTGRLLTRYSPVRHYASVKQASPRTVRLECVMHAASVYPEPGSNSLNMVYIPDIVRYTSELIPLSFLFRASLNFKRIFRASVCSRIPCAVVVQFSRSLPPLPDSLIILSHSPLFVNPLF